MNPSIHKAVSETVAEIKILIAKEVSTDQELRELIKKKHAAVETMCSIDEFTNLCVLHQKYNFIGISKLEETGGATAVSTAV